MENVIVLCLTVSQSLSKGKKTRDEWKKKKEKWRQMQAQKVLALLLSKLKDAPHGKLPSTIA